MNAEYEIEKHPHGWLMCAAPGRTGIPLTAFSECMPMFGKDSGMYPGIAHHFNASGYDKHVVIAVSTAKEAGAWVSMIDEKLKDCNPQDRWWRGVDVGKSSAALFHVLCDKNWKWCSDHLGQKATPQDAADFGRCKRLLDAIPDWRGRLDEVSAKYAGTAWPKIVARWQEIESAPPHRVNEILRECHNSE